MKIQRKPRVDSGQRSNEGTSLPLMYPGKLDRLRVSCRLTLLTSFSTWQAFVSVVPFFPCYVNQYLTYLTLELVKLHLCLAM